jgi:hypothetical protein
MNHCDEINLFTRCTVLGPDLKNVRDLVPLLVAVTGRVWTDAPLKCELTDRRAAMAEVFRPCILPRFQHFRHCALHLLALRKSVYLVTCSYLRTCLAFMGSGEGRGAVSAQECQGRVGQRPEHHAPCLARVTMVLAGCKTDQLASTPRATGSPPDAGRWRSDTSTGHTCSHYKTSPFGMTHHIAFNGFPLNQSPHRRCTGVTR